MFDVLKDLLRKMAGAGKGQPSDREGPAAELLGKFLFEDGVVVEAGVFSDSNRVVLRCDAPMLPRHAEYSAKRMRRNFRQGSIYSAEDWRSIEITLTGVGDVEAYLDGDPLDTGVTNRMPYELDIEELIFENRGAGTVALKLEAEALRLNCTFKEFCHEDWPAPPSE